MQVVTLSKKTINKRPKTEVEEQIKKMQKEEEKLVKGKFEFVDAEGGFFPFTYKKYKGSISIFTFVHGEICEIPLGIVRHLNNTMQKIKRYTNVEQPPVGALKQPRTVETKSRVRFVPVDYL